MHRLDDPTRGRSTLGLAALKILLASCVAPVLAQTTPQDAAAAQPVLPQSNAAARAGSASPIVESLVGKPQPALVVHKRPMHVVHRHVRHFVGRRAVPFDFDRPALAGVELLYPLPPPGEPPHIVVPTPDYALDTIAASFLTPAPPVVCHPVRRDPDLPDPHLYREQTVACQPDNP